MPRPNGPHSKWQTLRRRKRKATEGATAPRKDALKVGFLKARFDRTRRKLSKGVEAPLSDARIPKRIPRLTLVAPNELSDRDAAKVRTAPPSMANTQRASRRGKARPQKGVEALALSSRLSCIEIQCAAPLPAQRSLVPFQDAPIPNFKRHTRVLIEAMGSHRAKANTSTG